MTVSWLQERATATPNAVALRCSERTITFGELEVDAHELAGRLLDSGIKDGDRVAIAADSSIGWVVAFHALDKLRAVAVPLNLRLRQSDHREQMERVGAGAVLFDADYGNKVSSEGMPGTVRVVYEGLLLGRGLPGRSRTPAVTKSHEPHDQTLCIVFTSGTTGVGKPVELTRTHLWWGAMGSLLNLGSRADDLWLDCLPLFHVGGLAILVRSILYGTPVWLQPGFDIEQVNDALDSGCVTVVSLVATMLSRLLDARVSRPYPEALRCVLLGGGPIPPSVVERCLHSGIPIAPTFGMTETGSQSATLRPELLAKHPDSAGCALLGVDITIDRASGDEFGEILVAGPSVAVRHQPFHTGDLGTLDVAGYLRVSDRRQDLIVSGGENVHPTEVESVLLKHPNVRDVGVVGIPDDEWGSAVVAVVVPTAKKVDVSELEVYCRKHLPTFSCPKAILILNELPRTASGKLLRGQLRYEVLNRRSAGG
jgi:O-succinylbenzoic acid--CoA ligase